MPGSAWNSNRQRMLLLPALQSRGSTALCQVHQVGVAGVSRVAQLRCWWYTAALLLL